MNTDDLIGMLASDPRVDRRRRDAEAALALAAGIALSIVLMVLLLGVRANLAQALTWPAFWLKVTFTLALALAGWRASTRLARPGGRAGLAALAIAAVLLAMWALGARTLFDAAPALRLELFWGQTWRGCSALIALLSLPIFTAALWAMRQMAPTRLRLAGAAAGFASGATAAAVYCLHCPELASSFVGVWYVLGMLVPTLAGAALGRRVLAW